MKELEVGDNEQVHAAFLVYMDLSEGELESWRQPVGYLVWLFVWMQMTQIFISRLSITL